MYTTRFPRRRICRCFKSELSSVTADLSYTAFPLAHLTGGSNSASAPLCLCPSASAPPCTAFIYCVVLPLVHIRHNFPSLINRMVRHFFIYLPIFHPAALLSFPETREPGTARFFQAARPVTDKDPANHRACRCLGINAYTIR